MSLFSQAKSIGKRWIGAPTTSVPVISTADYVRSLSTDPKADAINYLRNLFPFLQWIGRYNLGWLTGDLIAGITVGIVLVPQSMGYAQIALLPSQYGLYSSFVGVFIYCFFATSKDVSIGPVAVMSLETAQIIQHVQAAYGVNAWPVQVIATTVAFMSGFIVLGIGLLRLGWLVEFIPAPAVSGFMTGSALNIAAGQLPQLFGVQNHFDTRAATYLVVINTLKYLHLSTLDAAFGVTGLVSLYLIRTILQRVSDRYPRARRTMFFLLALRNGFVVIVLTLSAWLYCRLHEVKGNYPLSLLLTVPRGFQDVGQPYIDRKLLAAIGPELPVATIILLLEHIAIAKSFGRVNGYKINPNQELIAIGVTNTVGSVFHAYPSTGSFSRSALKAKSGVRTPAAGWFTGIVVIVALYGLTDAFFWIPKAALSAVIIHAVMDLVASPAQVYSYWRISPLEFVIWAAAVLVTVFSSIEDGIYTSILSSVALLLVRIARPRGHFLGRVRVRPDGSVKAGQPGEIREVWVPLDLSHNDAGVVVNPAVKVEPPPPGIIIYRFEESFTYPNSSLLNNKIVDYAKEQTRKGKDMSGVSNADRPWNDPGPRKGHPDPAVLDAHKPILRAVILDFSAVGQLDTTGVQNLVDVRAELERWADAPVEFHFANVLSPWIRRALVAGGFGTGDRHGAIEVAPVVPPNEGGWGPGLGEEFPARPGTSGAPDVESPREGDEGKETANSSRTSFEAPILSTSTPFFHFDLSSAVRAAEMYEKPQ